MDEPNFWVQLISNVGVAGAFLILLGLALWRCSPTIFKPVKDAVVKYFETCTATQESNAKALEKVADAQEQLTITSVKSGENHAKTHKAGMVAADALQAFADTHSPQASAAVKPHVEKIKEILDR